MSKGRSWKKKVTKGSVEAVYIFDDLLIRTGLLPSSWKRGVGLTFIPSLLDLILTIFRGSDIVAGTEARVMRKRKKRVTARNWPGKMSFSS
ncbi:hypothetical protein AKJ57_03365 [candidate division MSBL1 archaeon SCGC-AAA259A05]|uniref:Uncharacterized protein n=1 Tax=candidate division MSBL1 archaeon SCGC-AAA259A05 TaxID=1698259 RepID=A0A133U9J3_9EURY|nr:hypothetical protein AKJ57_03365 [candidate division MSBL1 archaeon SCGC-AAA259A05]